MARILIVEDSADNMTLFQTVLRLAGHEVSGLPDGTNLVETLAATPPDLVLLDIQLPGRDGFALLQEIRANRGLRHLPVVALTAHAMAGDEEHAIEQGFTGYITKPIRVREFAKAVEAFLPLWEQELPSGSDPESFTFPAWGTMTDTDQKQDLLNAAQAAVADAKAKAEARAGGTGPGSRTRDLVTVAGLALTLAGFALAAYRPAWFLTPPPEPDPPVVEEASVRLTLVREAHRINGWRMTNGRLPIDQAEAGTPVVGLAYDRINDSVFAVSLPFGASVVTLRSTDSLSTFIGGAVATVAGRVGR